MIQPSGTSPPASPLRRIRGHEPPAKSAHPTSSRKSSSATNRPAISPQRIDCGLRKTFPSGRKGSACRPPFSRSVSRQQNKQGDADRQSQNSGINPKPVPRQPMLDQRPDSELPQRASGHPEHLRRADKRGGARRRKISRDQIHRAHQRKNTAGALQQPSGPGCKLLPAPKSKPPTPTNAAPIGITFFAPNRSIAAPATRLKGE